MRRRRAFTLLSMLSIVPVSASLAGCGVLTGTVVGATGQWPTTSTIEDKQWVVAPGAPAEPIDSLIVEARLDTPPYAVCEQRRYEPAARVKVDSYGFDSGGRLAYSFIGAAELGLAAAFAFVPRGDGPDADAPALDVMATVIGLDGLVTLALAFLIPDRHYQSEYSLPPVDVVRPECPADVAFEVDGHPLPVDPRGFLSPRDATSLMTFLIEHDAPVMLLHRGLRTATSVPPELRCTWAVELEHPMAAALCPRRPVPLGR
ncbi:MAG: hypothetical protein JNJ59_06765 [Deltaproteobacteria bacterium]|nr:hypothetical protein [Deltaproteobacteria bacterium]